jgi:hypothetical protein
VKQVAPPKQVFGGAPTTWATPKPISQGPKVSPTQAAGAAAAPAPPPADPYDSQYYIDLATATKAANDQIAGLNQNIGDARTGLQQTYANLARQLAQQNTQAQNDENTAGGFAQGALSTTLGNLASDNQTQTTSAQLAEQQQEDTWNAAISAANQGLSTEQIALGLASADRKAALVANSGGTLGTDAPAAPAAPISQLPAPTNKGNGKTKGKGPTPPKGAKGTTTGAIGGFKAAPAPPGYSGNSGSGSKTRPGGLFTSRGWVN